MRVPGYELLEEIARGGMGIVYRARQLEPRRTVALKMLLPHQAGSREQAERFRLEVRALSELEHPAILPVHQMAEHDGLPFFTMKLATGGTLAQRKSQYAANWRAIAQLLAVLADAVYFAHERGVLHRDLKPSNILFDEQNHPYVSDFGLAKLADAATDLTSSVDFLGTPHYVAPEIATLSARNATTASDIYSLGAILYELLSGRPPFEAESIPGLLRKIVDEDPISPSALNSKAEAVPRDLEVICLKCLAKEPAHRYESARAFADDLRRWLDGRPIMARPVSAVGRIARWARRNPAVAVLSGTLTLAVIVGVLGLLRVNRSLSRAIGDSRQSLYQSLLDQARAVRQKSRIGQRFDALEAIRQASRIDRTIQLRNEAAAALAEMDLELQRSWPLFWGTALGVAEFDPELDSYLAGESTGGFSLYSTSDERVLKHYAPGARKVALHFKFGPRATRLAAWFNDGSVEVWDRNGTSHLLRLAGTPTAAAQMDFHPDGRTLALAQPGKAIRLVVPGLDGEDISSEVLDASATNVVALHFDPSGSRLAVVRSNKVEVWDCEQKKPMWTVAAGGSRGSGIWSADGRLIAVIDDSSMEILILAVQDGSVVARFSGHRISPVQVAFHPGGQIVVSVGLDRTLRLWEVRTGHELLSTDAGHCISVRFSSDGRRLGTATGDISAGVYELSQSSVFHELQRTAPHKAWASSIACSPDGRFLLTSEDGGLRIWDSEHGRELQYLPLLGVDMTPVFFGRDGGSIIYSRRRVGTFRRDFSAVSGGAAESPLIKLGEEERLPVPLNKWLLNLGDDGKTWLIGGTGDSFEVWPDGDPKMARVVHGDVSHGVVYGSDDGRWVAKPRSPQAGMDIWDMRSGDLATSLKDAVYTVGRFSPDGRWLVGGSPTVYQFWSMPKWVPGPRFAADIGGFEHGDAAFSRDSRLAVLRSRPDVLELVGLPDPHSLLRLEPPEQLGTMEFAFSPDGQKLWILGHGARVFEWNLTRLRSELAALGLDWK
jgi:WD40 repeat protein